MDIDVNTVRQGLIDPMLFFIVIFSIGIVLTILYWTGKQGIVDAVDNSGHGLYQEVLINKWGCLWDYSIISIDAGKEYKIWYTPRSEIIVKAIQIE